MSSIVIPSINVFGYHYFSTIIIFPRALKYYLICKYDEFRVVVLFPPTDISKMKSTSAKKVWDEEMSPEE